MHNLLRLRPATRQWLAEIGNITLGVLIALGLGWVAAEIGWRQSVREARAGIREELAKFKVRAAERARTVDCVERRLDQMAGILDASERSGRLPPLGEIGVPPVRSWSRGIWDSAIDADTKAHFELRYRSFLATTYDLAPLLARYNAQEVDLWTRLYEMVGPGRPITQSDINGWRGAIGAARQANRSMWVLAHTVVTEIEAGDPEGKRLMPFQRGMANRSFMAICAPIPAATGQPYGAAPFRDVLAIPR